MMSRSLLLTIALAVGTPAAVSAQSLAAIAESGGTTESATRTYTNDDLLADGGASKPSAPAPAPAPVETPAVDIPPAAAKRVIVEENVGAGSVNLIIKPEKSASAENEPFWRKVTKSVKDRLTTAENELATISARLETADPRERERLMTLRSKAQRDIELINAEFAGHQKRAKALGVPAEWLR